MTPPTGTGAMIALLYVLGIVAFVLVAFAVYRFLSTLPPKSPPSTATTETLELPTPRLPPADLADEGNYGEAVHAMLLLALKQLADRGGLAARHSATSREILGDTPLDAAARQHLEVLVAGVEAWWFGGRELTRAEYDRCARAWASLRPALGAT
ncbi:MAG: DUF4129 domain-containing protein [Planctomycetota bacterium]